MTSFPFVLTTRTGSRLSHLGFFHHLSDSAPWQQRSAPPVPFRCTDLFRFFHFRQDFLPHGFRVRCHLIWFSSPVHSPSIPRCGRQDPGAVWSLYPERHKRRPFQWFCFALYPNTSSGFSVSNLSYLKYPFSIRIFFLKSDANFFGTFMKHWQASLHMMKCKETLLEAIKYEWIKCNKLRMWKFYG